MIPRTKKLFISYRSSDAAKVDKIAHDLALLKYEDGTPRYIPWQDKHNLPPASPNWWDAIVDAIIDNDMFVFNISQASLQSEVCLAELDYANRRNRPIIPVVLEGEFFLDPKSGKYNIEYWDLVPEWLTERQFLFYTGAEFYSRFQQAVELFERKWPRDLKAPRPMNPDAAGGPRSNHALYDTACDYAERLAFADAEKHFRTLVQRDDPDYAGVAAEWLELLDLYAELIEIDKRRSARFKFREKWKTYEALFPKVFLDDIFDPKNFRQRNGKNDPPRPQTAPPLAKPPAPTKPRSSDILPAPFAWVEIPGKGYSIAKYPVTNAHFAKFIEAGGYDERRWWTDAGWEAKIKGWMWDSKQKDWIETSKPWTEPRYWQDAEWEGPEHPVVGVSWYESMAFCLWLSELTGEKIMLPTEAQWQYAAQGDDGRVYPWGNDWDCQRCNNSVKPCKNDWTTSVGQYEGKGDSPFGVVDMAGNVREWCLTAYKTGSQDISGKVVRVARGGSCFDDDIDRFRCDYRNHGAVPHIRLDNGFRISRPLATPEQTEAPVVVNVPGSAKSSADPLSAGIQQARSDILPAPFAWVEIPGGRGTLKTDEDGVTLAVPTERYWIARYPVANAHFAKFIEAGGYRERRWWTDAGWEARAKGWAWKDGKYVETGQAWTEPRYWRDSKWNGPEQPVVGVSWYEALAFCLWLSDVTGEQIMLPTGEQWQYAAQGDDGWKYPWGDKWDCKRCNNSVKPCKSDRTTPVRQYEGIGDSPFGVVDMAGNVWEWCLTAYETRSQDINGTDARVLRGGSWANVLHIFFYCVARESDKHIWEDPRAWDIVIGFRIVRIP